MPPFPVGMGASHHHRVLVEQIPQLGKGQEVPRRLVGGKTLVQLQDGLQRADGQNVPSLGDVRLHAGEDPQAVFQHQGVALPGASGREVAVQLVKLQGVEVLCQAEGVQAGVYGLAKEPVGVHRGEGQPLGQLAVGVKIQFQGDTSFLNQSGKQNGQGNPQQGDGQKQQVVGAHL